MKTPLALLIAAAATLGSFVMGSAPAARADDLGYFQQQVDPYLQKPKFVAPGPAFDASACMKGKTILSIPVSSANPFTANIEKAMVAVAQQVGFTFINWQNQGQSSQWVQGMNAAINQKVNLIDLLAGADPRVLVPQIGAARAAHIPVVASHYAGREQTPIVLKYADGDVPIDYAKAGALLADWAIIHTKGHMDALVLIATGPLSTDSMLNGINGELKHCADCHTKVMNFVVTDWGTRITPAVQAALLSDPKVNYIIVIYDSMSQFVVPAVTITGSTNRVKIDAFNGTPFVLGLVQTGAVQMDIGENLDWIGHGILDSEMRRVCALPLVHNPEIPFYIFTQANAKDAGTPPKLSQGYGDAYVAGFDTLWKLH
jgi:ribose transport system substrate-binding protein